MSYESFSSLPPEEERHFAVFEEFTQQNAKRANVIGIVAALAFGGVLVGIVAAFWGSMPKPKFDEGAEEETAAASAPAPTPAPAPAPAAAAAATDTPAAAAPAPAGDQPAAAAPAAGAAPAQPIPAGATKAPPPH